MMVLSRENIIEGLIELNEESEYNNVEIIENIRKILDKNNIDNIDKLKLINNELGKIILAWKLHINKCVIFLFYFN